jgi:hypothetical protein
LYIKNNANLMNEVYMIFQLAHTIYLLEQKMISHNDIFMQNITCKKVTEKSMVYVINNQSIEIPILDGHVPVLIDFGQTRTYTKHTKSEVEDLNMLLKTWAHYTTLPQMKRFLRMVIKKNKAEKINTKDFLLKYYNTYIKQMSIHV